jgi:predicted restriction endonuclease
MSKEVWKDEVKERDCHRCKICGTSGSKKNPLTVHHKRAKANKGGANVSNGVCWCWDCHKEYHKKWGITTSDDYGNPVEPKHTYKKKHKHHH